MELRQLRYFCAVAEDEHFGRAAKRLHIAQPALSRQVRQLELEFGIDLFDRLPRGVRLTAAGRQFLDDAQRVLSDFQNLTERAKAAGKGETGRLRLGVAESASSRGRMVDAIIRFRAANPNVVVDIQHMTSLPQIDAIASRQIDAGFLYHFPGDRPDLDHLPAEFTDVLLAMPRNHRLAKMERVKLADLRGEPSVWIKRSTQPATYDLLMMCCLNCGLSPNIVQETTSESVSLGLVSVGGMLSFVTDTNRDRCPGNVILRKIDELSIRFRLDLVWRKGDSQPTLQRFIETMLGTAD
ncbi:MAG: LysR substrate-binding domain-containing protein [Mesorhizobium sp.]|nr:LysR substrate-binding domain-containing protein [Mesorhizobium sp.]MCO5164103.1 LysR substrate-binding domain-containing protein [Mesorhizobium sp.]